MIDERKSTVLRAVVRDYIRTAEPVASMSLAKRHHLGVSPATIRHEMAELEGMGYLMQPHTSAGRVPTDSGYRFYVDALPTRLSLPTGLRRTISAFFGEVPPDVDEVAHQTAQLLSRITGYAAVALAPQLALSRVVRTDLVRLGTAALLVVVGDMGRVDKRALELPQAVDDAALDRVSQRVEDAFSGLAYAEAGLRARSLAERAQDPDRTILSAVSHSFQQLDDDPAADRVFIGGAANIAGEESFQERDILRRLFATLEEGPAVRRLLAGLPSGTDIAVHIGREHPVRAMRVASTVIAPYRVGRRPAGIVAVIGPTRMEYRTAISATRVVARRLSDFIGTFAG